MCTFKVKNNLFNIYVTVVQVKWAVAVWLFVMLRWYPFLQVVWAQNVSYYVRMYGGHICFQYFPSYQLSSNSGRPFDKSSQLQVKMPTLTGPFGSICSSVTLRISQFRLG